MISPEEESDEIIPEDWPTYYTQVPVWILLAPIPAQAYRMYAFLAEHINTRTPGQRISCPKQAAIARVLGLANPRQVARYADALERLGALRVDEYRYSGGMRRGYRYRVRFNPPPGYAGKVSLSGFYEANPDVRSASADGRTSAAMAIPAGHDGGTENSTVRGATRSTAHGASSSTPKRDQGERDQVDKTGAPTARSADDGRQATTGSRHGSGGKAASGKSRHRLAKAEYDAIKTVRSLLPDDLEKALPVKTPANLGTAVIEALAVGAPCERTPQQLVEFRVLPRWNGYWAQKFYGKELASTVGPLLAMLAYQQECGDISCEDRVNIHTGEPCTGCAERRTGQRPASVAGAEVELPRPTLPEDGRPRGLCSTCGGLMFVVGPALEDGLCRECRADVRTPHNP